MLRSLYTGWWGVIPRKHRPGEAPPPPLGEHPPHWAPDGTFRCPWLSYIDYGPMDYLRMVRKEGKSTPLSLYPLPTFTPDPALLATPPAPPMTTWIGHATFLVQVGGWNILTDPMFSSRASPVQWAGPARYTPPACGVKNLPQVDVVVLSHNHYDHLDANSVAALLAKESALLASPPPPRTGEGQPHKPYNGTLWVVPLHVKAHLVGMGVPPSRVVELDWWDSFTPALAPGGGGGLSPDAGAGEVTVHGPTPAGGRVLPLATTGAPTIYCVPAQHQSARTIWDRNHSLWAGFVMAAPAPGGGHHRVYFTGDTGYRSVPLGAGLGSPGEAAAPVCPAFAEIGASLGPFDLGLLPIGAYSPRTFMSSFHASPEDAVCMHKDARCATSIGMHWGTFALTDEPIEEPPARLAAAADAAGLPRGSFLAVWPGCSVVGGAGAVQTDRVVVGAKVRIPVPA